jgi:uncharacterized membrane protein YsdA (DUF1294 family)
VDWRIYWYWLAAATLITFLLYGIDKALSKRKGSRRISEITFHIFTLLGGFIGGWLGMSVFRHKTKHGIIIFMLVLGTLIHLALWYWIYLRDFRY